MSYINNLYLLNRCLAKKYKLAVEPKKAGINIYDQPIDPAAANVTAVAGNKPTSGPAINQMTGQPPIQGNTAPPANTTVNPLQATPTAKDASTAPMARAAPPSPTSPTSPTPPKKPLLGSDFTNPSQNTNPSQSSIPKVSKDFNSALAKVVGAGKWTKKHIDNIKNAISEKRMNTFLYGAGGAFSPAMRAQHLSGVDNQVRDFLINANLGGKLTLQNSKHAIHGIDLIHRLASTKASPEAKAKVYKEILKHTKKGTLNNYTAAHAAKDIKDFKSADPEIGDTFEDQDEQGDPVDVREEENPGSAKKMTPRS